MFKEAECRDGLLFSMVEARPTWSVCVGGYSQHSIRRKMLHSSVTRTSCLRSIPMQNNSILQTFTCLCKITALHLNLFSSSAPSYLQATKPLNSPKGNLALLCNYTDQLCRLVIFVSDNYTIWIIVDMY